MWKTKRRTGTEEEEREPETKIVERKVKEAAGIKRDKRTTRISLLLLHCGLRYIQIPVMPIKLI